MDLGPIRPDGQSFASRAAAGLESGRELSRLSAGFGSVCSTPDICLISAVTSMAAVTAGR